MKRSVYLFIVMLACISALAQKTKQDVIKSIDAKYDQYSTTAKKIWDFAEVGYQEEQSSALLQQTLKDAGFSVQANIAGEPTAFIASYGSGKPVIGILGEYDALPGISQDAVPELKPIPGKKAGHACGHHLFGTASAAAAIAVKDWMIANKKTERLGSMAHRLRKVDRAKYTWCAMDFSKTLTSSCIGTRGQPTALTTDHPWQTKTAK